MKTSFVSIPLVTASAMLLACSSSSPNAPFGNAPDAGSDSAPVETSSHSSDGVSLSVASATSPTAIGGIAPPSGSTFLAVVFTIKNTGAPRPLSSNPVLFSLQTDKALVLTVAPVEPEGMCDATVSVAAGGELSCTLAFDLPTGQSAASLLYNDVQGDTASAPVPAVTAPAPTACNGIMDWYNSTKSACTSCLDSACATADSAYTNACLTCSDKCGTANDTCACEAQCDTPTCQKLWNDFVSCLSTSCGSHCP